MNINTIKKIQLFIFGLVLFFNTAHAAAPYVEPVKNLNIINILNGAMNWLFGLMLVVASAFILYAAYLYLTAGGNPETLKIAKNFIVYTIVALIVAFLSKTTIYIVQQLITNPGNADVPISNNGGGGGGGGSNWIPQ